MCPDAKTLESLSEHSDMQMTIEASPASPHDTEYLPGENKLYLEGKKLSETR